MLAILPEYVRVSSFIFLDHHHWAVWLGIPPPSDRGQSCYVICQIVCLPYLFMPSLHCLAGQSVVFVAVDVPCPRPLQLSHTSWLPGFARVPSLLPSSPPYLSSSLRASLPPPFFTLHPFLLLPHPYSLLYLLYLLPPSSLLSASSLPTPLLLH